MTIRFSKQQGNARLDWQVWTERSKLVTMLLTHIPKTPVPSKREEKPYPSAAAAKEALEEFVADLKAQGVVLEGEWLQSVAAPPVAEEKPSKPWPTVARPQWLARLTHPLGQ